jgi:hypothetical protein
VPESLALTGVWVPDTVMLTPPKLEVSEPPSSRLVMAVVFGLGVTVKPPVRTISDGQRKPLIVFLILTPVMVAVVPLSSRSRADLRR